MAGGIKLWAGLGHESALLGHIICRPFRITSFRPIPHRNCGNNKPCQWRPDNRQRDVMDQRDRERTRVGRKNIYRSD